MKLIVIVPSVKPGSYNYDVTNLQQMFCVSWLVLNSCKNICCENSPMTSKFVSHSQEVWTGPKRNYNLFNKTNVKRFLSNKNLEGEREKRKDQLLELQRSKQERTDAELTNLRQVYERQHRDLSLLQLNLDSKNEVLIRSQLSNSLWVMTLFHAKYC